MLKSYAGDFESAKGLIASFLNHNVDSLKLHIVVPEADKAMFSMWESEVVDVIAEESIPVRMATSDVNGIRPGYINQELAKLGFFLLGLSDAYLCLDSDAVFLNDFTLDDFLHSSGSPYTVLAEDRELHSDPSYYAEHWENREAKLAIIRNFLNLPRSNTYLTCHGFQIFQASVLQRLMNEVLTPKGMDFLDLLTISPYEFSWYNYFLQSTDIPIFVREPYFRVVHSGGQYATERMAGFSEEDWARGYLGLVLNSNFQHTVNPISYDSWAPFVMAVYAKPSFLFAVWAKVTLAIILSAGKIPASFAMRILKGQR